MVNGKLVFGVVGVAALAAAAVGRTPARTRAGAQRSRQRRDIHRGAAGFRPHGPPQWHGRSGRIARHSGAAPRRPEQQLARHHAPRPQRRDGEARRHARRVRPSGPVAQRARPAGRSDRPRSADQETAGRRSRREGERREHAGAGAEHARKGAARARQERDAAEDRGGKEHAGPRGSAAPVSSSCRKPTISSAPPRRPTSGFSRSAAIAPPPTCSRRNRTPSACWSTRRCPASPSSRRRGRAATARRSSSKGTRCGRGSRSSKWSIPP